jgi:hypothetical protein
LQDGQKQQDATSTGQQTTPKSAKNAACASSFSTNQDRYWHRHLSVPTKHMKKAARRRRQTARRETTAQGPYTER